MQGAGLMRNVLCAGVVCVALAAPVAAQGTLPMELRIPDETAVPGGVIQLKLEVTEPRPISTGGGGFSFGDYDQFLGLAIGSAGGDAAAAGVMRGSTLRLRMVSPSGNLGVAPDYPILTTTMRVPALSGTFQIGKKTTIDLQIDAFAGPGGTAIPTITKPGVATVASGAAVSNVEPGGATVAAGGVITITGVGFEMGGTDVKLKGTALSRVTVISPTRIEIVPARDVDMQGAELELEIRSTRQRFFYYSYQRTVPIPYSTDSLMSAVEPAFQRLNWTAAAVPFGAPGAGKRLGLAVQNPSASPVPITISLVNGAAPSVPVRGSMPPNSRLVASLTEYFGTSCTAACTVRVQAAAPIQVLGLLGDVPADVVDPVLPVADTIVPAVLDFTSGVNAASYRAGDPLVVTANFAPGAAPVTADAYVVLVDPGGNYYSLTPAGVVAGVAPLYAGRVVDQTAAVEVLRAPLPGGVPLGTYRWLTALAVPGTAQLLTPIRTTTFTVTP